MLFCFERMIQQDFYFSAKESKSLQDFTFISRFDLSVAIHFFVGVLSTLFSLDFHNISFNQVLSPMTYHVFSYMAICA
jgi:hypothetical protein